MTDYTDIATKTARKTQGLVLIDKLHLAELNTDIVDMDKLKSKVTVFTSPDGKPSFRISNDGIFSRFDYNLQAGRKKMDGSSSDGLQTMVINKSYGNLICDNISSLNERLDIIKDRLFNEYGIKISYEFAVIKYVEINKTIHLQHGTFQDYRRIFSLMTDIVPDKYGLVFFMLNGVRSNRWNNLSKKEIQTYTLQNIDKTLTLTIYDKSEEIRQQGLTIADSFMRLEYKLKRRNVKRYLGIDRLIDLEMDIIENFFVNAINDMFIIPYQEYRKSAIEYLSFMFREEHEKDEKHFIKAVLDNLTRYEADDTNDKPVILDGFLLSKGLDEAGYNEHKHHRMLSYWINTKFTRFHFKEYDRMKEVLGKLKDIFITNVD